MSLCVCVCRFIGTGGFVRIATAQRFCAQLGFVSTKYIKCRRTGRSFTLQRIIGRIVQSSRFHGFNPLNGEPLIGLANILRL